VYFIGEVGISGTEILVFDHRCDAARPPGQVLGAVQARVRCRMIAPELKKKAPERFNGARDVLFSVRE